MKAVITDEIPINYGPWLRLSPEGLQLVQQLLMRDPSQRITAADALQHSWFRRHLRQANGSAHMQQKHGSTVANVAIQELQDAAALNNIVPLAPHCTLLTPHAATLISQ